MRDSPPAWWPCEVAVGEVQRVVSWQTSVPMACDMLADNPYMTDYVAVEADGVTLDFIQCSTPTNCVGYDAWSFNLSSMSMWNQDANACQVTLSEPTQTTDTMGNNVYDVSLLVAYAPIDETKCRWASFNEYASEASCFMRYVLVAEPL
jgi:hypothetical protein